MNKIKIGIFRRPENTEEPKGVYSHFIDGINAQVFDFVGDNFLNGFSAFKDNTFNYKQSFHQDEIGGEKIFSRFPEKQIKYYKNMVKNLDGLILPGFKPYINEALLARLAVEEGLPVLAICNGQTVLSVAFGGTEGWSKGTDHVDSDLDGCHSCKATVPRSKLWEMLKFANKRTFACNSYHNCSIKNLGKPITRNDGKQVELVATGFDNDGNIEVLESKTNGKFDGLIMATRFHPEIQSENIAETNTIYNRIKANFIKQATSRHLEKEKAKTIESVHEFYEPAGMAQSR